jgi:hypothetical protein
MLSNELLGFIRRQVRVHRVISSERQWGFGAVWSNFSLVTAGT